MQFCQGQDLCYFKLIWLLNKLVLTRFHPLNFLFRESKVSEFNIILCSKFILRLLVKRTHFIMQWIKSRIWIMLGKHSFTELYYVPCRHLLKTIILEIRTFCDILTSQFTMTYLFLLIFCHRWEFKLLVCIHVLSSFKPKFLWYIICMSHDDPTEIV